MTWRVSPLPEATIPASKEARFWAPSWSLGAQAIARMQKKKKSVLKQPTKAWHNKSGHS
jgi:hypothetical protein